MDTIDEKQILKRSISILDGESNSHFGRYGAEYAGRIFGRDHRFVDSSDGRDDGFCGGTQECVRVDIL